MPPHSEAVARISWCITERRIGVITGEVGAGKTVAIRTALSSLDASRHVVIHLPNPTIGVRGIRHQIAAFLDTRTIVEESSTRTAIAEVTAE
jgi:type II secretory pathway predicted ATPase ExeA